MKKNKILIISLGILFMNKISIVNALDKKSYFPGSNNQIIRLNRLFTDELDILDPEKLNQLLNGLGSSNSCKNNSYNSKSSPSEVTFLFII